MKTIIAATIWLSLCACAYNEVRIYAKDSFIDCHSTVDKPVTTELPVSLQARDVKIPMVP